MYLTTRSMQLLIAAMALAALFSLAPAAGADDYQAHCLNLGEDPTGQTSWSDGVNGITHDDANWYISQQEALWRVPVGLDLGSVNSGTLGVLHRDLFPELGLDSDDTWIFSSPRVFRFGGTDYLFVKLEQGLQESLVVFDADSLLALDTSTMLEHPEAFGIDPSGTLYMQHYSPVPIYPHAVLDKWTVNWQELQQLGVLSFNWAGSQILYDDNGIPEIGLPHILSIDFTPDGRYCYIMASGIHIFDAQTGVRIHQSTNGAGFFPLQWVIAGESPASLAIWNLEGSPSPHDGQLHVVVRDNDHPDPDDVRLVHYTDVIRVHANASPPWYGTPLDPFATVSDAVNIAWHGAEILIDPGTYDEALAIGQMVRLRSSGGTARIGG